MAVNENDISRSIDRIEQTGVVDGDRWIYGTARTTERISKAIRDGRIGEYASIPKPKTLKQHGPLPPAMPLKQRRKILKRKMRK